MAVVSVWSTRAVATFCTICFLVGIVAGALIHGGPSTAKVSSSSEAASMTTSPRMMAPRSSSDDPLAAVLAELQTKPNDPDLLAKAGNLSMQRGAAKMALSYYERSLAAKDDPAVRVNLGNAYFRAGEPDKALAEFATVLKADPQNDSALFNSGAITWQAKHDAKTATKYWQTLLRYHPDHPRRAGVEHMIASVKNSK